MHRHKYEGRKFKREAGHRGLMLRNLATSLVLHEKIKTTLAKAKEIKPIVEKLITKASKGDLASRRSLASYLLDNNAVEKLIVEIAPIHKNRNGGYTRIVSIGKRLGDSADMAYIEILDMEKAVKVVKESKKSVQNKETKVSKSIKEVKPKSVKKTVKKPEASVKEKKK